MLKTYFSILLLTTFACLTHLSFCAPTFASGLISYPAVRRVDTTFTYASAALGQVIVSDPYNWLEANANVSSEVQQFVDAQNTFTQQYLDACSDIANISAELKTLTNYARFGAPQAQGPYSNPSYYYTYDPGTGYVGDTWYKVDTRDELLAAERNNYNPLPGNKFFDATLLSSDNSISLYGLYFSPATAKTVAYTLSSGGDAGMSVYFRSTDKPFVDPVLDPTEAAKGGPDRLPDELHNVRYGDIVWTKDELGVFYLSYEKSPSSNNLDTEAFLGAQIYFHLMGTKQEEDIVVLHKDPDSPTSTFEVETTPDGKWLIAWMHQDGGSSGSRTWISALGSQPISSDMKWTSIAAGYSFKIDYIANDDDVFYFQSNEFAPNSKVVRARVLRSNAKSAKNYTDLYEQADFEDIVAEDKEAVLSSASIVDTNKLLLVYTKDVAQHLHERELMTGAFVAPILLDGMGITVNEINSRQFDRDAFVATNSFITPNTVFRLEFGDYGKDFNWIPAEIYHHNSTLPEIGPSSISAQQVFVPGDGDVEIPTYIIGPKSVPKDGSAPAYLYFRGAFGESIFPFFSITFLTWTKWYGGNVVVFSPRGGGELGETWHKAGVGINSQNSISDILSVSSYLVDQKIAAKGKLVLHGFGTTSMAAANQASEGLFGAVKLGNMWSDLLRYTQFTSGASFIPQFGDPSDPKAFDHIYKVSPLHNVKAGKSYPFMYIAPSAQFDSVPPLHSYKLVSTLQHDAAKSGNPLLLRVGNDTGVSEGPEENARQFCLFAQALGIERKPLPNTSL